MLLKSSEQFERIRQSKVVQGTYLSRVTKHGHAWILLAEFSQISNLMKKAILIPYHWLCFFSQEENPMSSENLSLRATPVGLPNLGEQISI
jgi:hypothetical protein